MSETTVVAIVSALFGFAGGLIPSLANALKLRADARLAAKQSDLDHLRRVIGELRAELDRRSSEREAERNKLETERQELETRIQALEKNCDEKDRLIGELETKIKQLSRERTQLETRITSLVEYIETLTGIMKSHNIPVPERKRNGAL